MKLSNLRYALRSLRRSPGFAAVAIVSLGLGLGLTTTMFALLDAVRHPYVPYRDAERLYGVWWITAGYLRFGAFDVYSAIRDETHSFTTTVPVSHGLRVTGAIGGEEMQNLGATMVPSRFFTVLGVKPWLGRVLTDADVGRNAVVVSYALWRGFFGNRRSPEGATLTLGDRVYSIAGVMPRGMDFPLSTDVWLPMSDAAEQTGAGIGIFRVLAKLRPGVTSEAADAELAALARQLTDRFHAQGAPFAIRLTSLRGDPMRLTEIHVAMLGASLAVLLIACANLANLMLARGLAKRREVALRLAIGASRSAVVWEMFAECMVLTAAGAALGVVLSLWGVDLLTNRVPREMHWFGILLPQLSWRVFALAAVAAAGSAVLFGLIPAVRVARSVSLDEPLKDGAGTTGRTRHRFSALVIAEIGLALVLVMGAGLLIKVVHRLAALEFNFAARRLLQTYAYAPKARAGSGADILRYEQSLIGIARGVPGVVDAATLGDVTPPGRAVTAELTGDSTRLLNLEAFSVVTPNYLRTMGLPVLEGRDFLEGDLAGNGAVILNAVAAARLYPRQRAVGHMVKLGAPASTGPWVPVVGVSRVAIVGRPSEFTELEAAVYAVRVADFPRRSFLMIRTVRDAPQITVALRNRLRAAGEYPYVTPYLDWYDSDLRRQGFLAQLFVTMGSFALVLAAVGIYGVLAYTVNRRLREFAVRIALGAQRADMLRMVLHDALVMALAGTGLGAFVALWASNLLENFLEDVPPTDVLTLVSSETVLMAVALAACLAPALRAMRADPIEILRAT